MYPNLRVNIVCPVVPGTIPVDIRARDLICLRKSVLQVALNRKAVANGISARGVGGLSIVRVILQPSCSLYRRF